MPLKELVRWARKRSRDERDFDRDLLVAGDMNILSRQSELFRAVRRRGLKLPRALAELRESKATTNLSRKGVCDQIVHHATNPARFTDNVGALDFYMGDHRGCIGRSICYAILRTRCPIICRCGSSSTHGSRTSSLTRG